MYGVFATTIRDRVLSRPGILDAMRKFFATTFVALGARLAVESR